MNLRGCIVSEAGVSALGIIPSDQPMATAARLGQASESFRKVRRVFQGLKLGLRERVVIADGGPREAFVDAEV